jgi:hypothetical protein
VARYIHVVLEDSAFNKTLVYSKRVRKAVFGNASFPTLLGLIPTLDAKIGVLDALETEAAQGMPGAVSARDAAREQVRELLFHTRDQVQGVAETLAGTTDLLAVKALVESAAMRLRKVPSRSKQVFAAKAGHVSGSADLTAPASRKRDSHDWQHSANQQDWTSVDSTLAARTTISGLAVNTPHYFRHRLLTKDGYTEWCAPILLMVK